jgi:hypothetical protein
MLFSVGMAGATPYWIEYSASSGNFPEDPQEGWTRYTWGGGDLRYFEDGALVLDAQGDPNKSDTYAWFRPGQLDPGPQEVFLAQWRLCVSQVTIGPFDPAVAVYSDAHTGLLLAFGYDSVAEPGQVIGTFEGGVFHDYEVRSPDMLSYDFYIDAVLVHSGQFYPIVSSSLVDWGDGAIPTASLSRWASFGLGVIPEPCSVWLVLAASLMRLKPRARPAARVPAWATHSAVGAPSATCEE